MTFWLVLASAAVLARAAIPDEKFVCVEWADHPHGYPAPIYYWNSAHEAYIWHGADCSMGSGEPFLCDSSRIHGEEGSDYAAYQQIQGTDDLAQRSRMAFFSSCRVTVNSIQQDADGAWIFRQNDSTEESAGKCTEANPWDCTGKGFSAGITVSAGSQACLNSPLAATSFQGYFEAIESDLVDGVNPVLSMPTAFKAMADGGLECNPVDKLPKLPVGEDSLYGVMSYDNSLSSQLVQRVMPKAQCYTEFESSLTIDGNQSCTDLAAKSYIDAALVAEGARRLRRRRLDEGGGSAGGTSVLAISALPSNGGAVVAASLASTVWLSVFASLLAGCFAC